MSTFSKATFNAIAYAASRPSYPPALYSKVLSYAPAPSSSSAEVPRTLLDLGCGPGLSTFSFLDSKSSSKFDKLIGIDPSLRMIQHARELTRKEDEGIIRFEVGSGEELVGLDERMGGGLGKDRVDLVVAGQAAHWFEAPKVYSELARVLKPGGAFVFWGYGEFFFTKYPELSKLIPGFTADTLGPYWQQPGRSIVEDLLRPFPFPSPSPSWDQTSFQRDFFDLLPGESQPSSPTSDSKSTQSHQTHHHPLLLTHTWTLAQLKAYLQTFSSVHSYREKHAAEGGEDVVDVFIEVLKERMKKEGLEEEDSFEVGWKMGMISGRKSLGETT